MTIPDLLVFGGTFDPPHVGHLQCVKTVLQRFSHAFCGLFHHVRRQLLRGDLRMLEPVSSIGLLWQGLRSAVLG